MKFSEKWLREWVRLSGDSRALQHGLTTMAGLEVDSVEPVAGDFTGVVVGEVLAVQQHPNANRLSVCEVTVDGSSALTIVCGASNVRKNLKVAVALVGARLPNDFNIKESVLRGVKSCGMLCSAQELGMTGLSDAGIMELPQEAPVGLSLREYLDLDDHSIDVAVTPNRGDCLSILGIAREVSAIFRCPLISVPIIPVEPKTRDAVCVTITDAAACPRYVGRLISGIDAKAPSPVWLKERLRRSGIRSVSAVVDVTHYVLLELGQPLHAFDAALVKGGITVRFAALQEPLKLLDGKNLLLEPNTLVIADETGAIALAGIMGGSSTAVLDTTTTVLLESAYFSPHAILGRARQYGLHTDASYRFERGVDPQLQRLAIERATQLLLEIVGGSAGVIIEHTASATLPTHKPVVFRPARVQRLLGFAVEHPELVSLLQRLGMSVSLQADHWYVTPPSYRSDIKSEIDLIEEVARLVGYDRIPADAGTLSVITNQHPPHHVSVRSYRELLSHLGYHETINYSFVDERWQQLIEPSAQAFRLLNPISAEMGVMRVSLLPGLLAALQRNQHRQQQRVRLFEIGNCFTQLHAQHQSTPASSVLQQLSLAGVAYGSPYPKQWGLTDNPIDFFAVKGDVERLLSVAHRAQQFIFKETTHPALHPAQGADIFYGNRLIGRVGLLHPALYEKLAILGSVALFEIDYDSIYQGELSVYQMASKFPEVARDIAIVVENHVTAQSVMDIIKTTAGELLQRVTLFDVYAGQGIASGSKSLALSLSLQASDRTLTDEEVNRLIAHVIENLERLVHAKLRD